MTDSDKPKITSSSESEIFSLSEDSFFNNLSDIDELSDQMPVDNEVANQKLQAVLKLSEELMTTYDIDEIFKLIMDNAIELTGAESGYIILLDKENMNVAYTMNMDVENKQDALKQVSTTVIKQVIDEKKVIIIKNALKDSEYEVHVSIVNLKLKSIMCVPMIVKDKVIGIIYIENRTISGIFNDETAELIKFFGSQCGIAIENYRLIQSNQEYSESLEKMVKDRTQELENQKKYTDNVLDNIGELLITVDNDYKILTINTALYNLLGLQPETFTAKPLNELYEEKSYVAMLEAFKKETIVSDIQCYIKNDKKQKVSFSATISPIIEESKTIGFIIINKDMTQVEKFEQERLERNELQSITKAAVTANDQINTPLGVIIGRAELMKVFIKGNVKAEKNLETIKDLAYRIRNTMNEMKKITEVKTTKYKLNGVEMIDLNKKK